MCVTQLVADRDKLTRSAALSMLATAYTMEGPPLWRVRATPIAGTLQSCPLLCATMDRFTSVCLHV